MDILKQLGLAKVIITLNYNVKFVKKTIEICKRNYNGSDDQK